MYQGQFFQVATRDQFLELIFDSKLNQINIFNKATLDDLQKAVNTIKKSGGKGLIIRSGKKLFSAGVDIKEFRNLIHEDETALSDYIIWANEIFNDIEDLNMPKVAILNGNVVSAGVELTLTAEYRIATQDTKISLPEITLGIMPCYGAMTRLPRITGLDTALQWFTAGKPFTADTALEHHVIDGVIIDKIDPIEQAVILLKSCLSGDLDWESRRNEKKAPLILNKYELAMSISIARSMAFKTAGKNYPAPNIILDTQEKSANCERDASLALDREGLIKCIKTGVADALINVSLNDTLVREKAKGLAKDLKAFSNVGVIGAGIMGGGIAYVTADKGADVVLKDINKEGLNLGLNEANSILSKQVERGRKTPKAMGDTLNHIHATIHNVELEDTDLIVEAVVENLKLKKAVLTELEGVATKAVIATNTSTLKVSDIAQALKNPENFCGIHFFNPVPKMPLVEVVRGEKTSDETIQKAIKYVTQLGKTPILVNDCHGFLVNRCLVPYFHAFNKLILDGAKMSVVDKVMSKEFGWPMGPAMLLDVIGLDTAEHCMDVMGEAFPDRMTKPEKNLIGSLFDMKHYGQKNGEGFYTHAPDRRGRLKASDNDTANKLIASLASPAQDFSADDIIMRMMLPMMFEAIRCLDEGIIASPAEGDIAMMYGTGFPPFRGGLFYYMDQIGLSKLVEASEKYKKISNLYHTPESLIQRFKNNQKFYA